jgi:hypothetical protein
VARRFERFISAGGEYFKGDKAHSAADMSEKIIKNSSETFEKTTYSVT